METFKYTTSSKTILADLYTPVGVYMRLRDLYPQSALMECADYHDAASSRSFIGVNPIYRVSFGRKSILCSGEEDSNGGCAVFFNAGIQRILNGLANNSFKSRVV